jgi:hypothetical protein
MKKKHDQQEPTESNSTNHEEQPPTTMRNDTDSNHDASADPIPPTEPATRDDLISVAKASPAATSDSDGNLNNQPLEEALARIDKKVPKKKANALKPYDVPDTIKDFYYGARDYQFRTPDERFISLCSGDVRTRLERLLSAKGYAGDELKVAITDAFILIQEKHSIDSVIEAAGFNTGLHTTPGGSRILIPSEATLPTSDPGDWSTLRRFMVGLLGEFQFQHLLGVLSVFTRHMWAIRADQSKVWTRQPLPAVAFAGSKGSGKTLLLSLVSALLGNRTANPSAYFNGKTRFNSEIIAAETLAIDDEMAAKDTKTRARIAQGIKQWLFAREVRVEAKYCNPVMMVVHSLLLFAMNDGPSSLLCLPTLDESMEDKISLLKVNKVENMFPENSDEKNLFTDQLFAELPHLLHYLLNEHEIDHSMRNHRTRIAAYQHPDLLEALADLSPETELLEICCEVLKDKFIIAMPDTNAEKVKVWKGKAFKLHTLLEASTKVSSLRLRQLLTSSSDLGTRLWEISNQHPDIVTRGSRSKGVRTFELHLSKNDILRFLPELEDELKDVGDPPDEPSGEMQKAA